VGFLNISEIQKLIKDVNNFPKEGIVFKDITPVFENAAVFKSLIHELEKKIPTGTTKLLAIESRGFILASALSIKSGIPFALVRKKGKLPRPTYSEKYELEYGTDELFIHKDSLHKDDNVLIIDDVLATGGTALAVENLCSNFDVKSVSSLFFIELTFLEGKKRLNFSANAILEY
jgi:adenine phosphoribosyltransferase